MILKRRLVFPRPEGTSLLSRALHSDFSMTEILSANAVMLAIALGIVPVFVRAMTSDSQAASDAAQASHFASSRMTELLDLEFDHAALTVLAGRQRETTEFYSSADDAWITAPPPGTQRPVWVRVTTVRQYGLEALDDGKVERSESLAADAPRELVRLKEIEVEVRRSGDGLSSGETVSLRTVRMS
jgi:hypothetical protein